MSTIRKVLSPGYEIRILIRRRLCGVYADWEDSVFCLPEEVKEAYRENCTEEWKKELRDVGNVSDVF